MGANKTFIIKVIPNNVENDSFNKKMFHNESVMLI